MQSVKNRRFLLLVVLPFLAMGGCSNGAAPTGSVTVSAQDLKAGTIHVAKTYLDSIEQMTPENRQLMVSKDPHVSEALKKAVAIDPATKARVETLGLKLP